MSKKIEIVLEGLTVADTGYHRIPLKDMGAVVDGSVDDIMIQDLLDYVDRPEELLNSIIKKIRYGGRLTITGTDITEIFRAYSTGGLSLDQTAQLIYNGKRQTTSATELSDKLRQRGLSIITVRTNYYKYAIIVERPNCVTRPETV